MRHTQLALLTTAVASSASLTTLAGSGGAPGGSSTIANREIARRMARLEDARQAIEKGDKFYADGDYEGALNQYKAALEAIPSAPATQEWRTLAETKYADACVALAQERAKTGRYKEARELLKEALDTRPDHRGAKTLSQRLDDPDRYPPALTPEHVRKVQQVERSLQKANSYKDLGDYDNALKEFQDTLRADPYNVAARRGMESVEKRKSNYFNSARDHQRARMLAQVDEMWEDKVPVQTVQVNADLGNGSKDGSLYLIQKMKSIRFPQVTFTGATIDEAVEYLRVKSKDLDTAEPDPSRRGVNIILKAGDTPAGGQISLDLRDVPMEEALRYITELAGMKFKVEPYAVLVVPITESTTEMITRIYKVPPDFLTFTGGGGDSAAPAAPADPFAKPGAAGASGGPKLMAKKTAREILAEQGIPFPEGASAVFNPVTSQLVVRNTAPNIDMVETFVESQSTRTPKMVYVTTKFVEVTQKNTDELGFDWLLGPFSIPGSSRVFGSGGSASTSTDFPLQNPGSSTGAIGTNEVSNGLRFGTAALAPDSVDGLLSNAPTTATKSPGVFALTGVLTDPQFQVVVRALGQKKGVDLMSAPSVTTKSGVEANVSVVREFLYPTEFNPPQIPQTFNSPASATISLLGVPAAKSSGSFPVTPTTPTAFTMTPVGVSMKVNPTVGPDSYTIDLVLAPEVTEFEGFINYGSPIQTSSTDALGNPTTIVLTENRIPQPVFSKRSVNTTVTVWDGQTVAMGGLIREDVQDVEDKIPLLGDLPYIGRLFQTKASDHFKRNLMVFVTAKLIDPSGQAVRQPPPPSVTADTQVDLIHPAALGAGILPPLMPPANQ